MWVIMEYVLNIMSKYVVKFYFTEKAVSVIIMVKDGSVDDMRM